MATEITRALLLIEVQRDIHRRISRAYENMRKLGSAKINRAVVVAREANLQTNWLKFEAQHNELIGLGGERSIKDRYFSDDLFAQVEEDFLSQRALFEDELAKFPASRTDLTNSIQKTESDSRSRSLLKRLDLPVFSGQLQEWPRFRDLFSSMVLNDAGLADVEKLQYLMISLSGEAAEVVANLRVSGENFEGAWKLLHTRYDNKRLLADAYLSSLTAIAPMKNNTAGELTRLLNGTCGAVKAMDALEMPIDQKDYLLVHLTVKKLDAATLQAWELSLGASTQYPSFSELTEFIQIRIRGRLSVEAKEVAPAVKQPGNSKAATSFRSAKTHVATRKGARQGRCPYCRSDHYLLFCEQFRDKPVVAKKKWVQENGCCLNCLGSHAIKDCLSTRRCQRCVGKHHTLLHDAFESVTTTPSASAHVTSTPTEVPVTVLLATAMVKIQTSSGETIRSRALIDPGSEVSLMTEALAHRLRLPRKAAATRVLGVGGKSSEMARGKVTVALLNHCTSKLACTVDALVLPSITRYRPEGCKLNTSWNHLTDLTLADPRFNKADPIELLLGAEVYGRIILEGLRKGESNSPIGQETTLGWILLGAASRNPTGVRPNCLQVSVDTALVDALKSFWEQEKDENPGRFLSEEEKAAENHFQKTFSRKPDGRYMVRLPTRDCIGDLGDSYTTARSSLASLERRFIRNPALKAAYTTFMEEYEHLGHMREIQEPSDLYSGSCFFLPHHGVFKTEGGKEKLRVVFNGSSRTRGGPSLNETLMVGPNLLPELAEVLCRWRLPRFAISADIEKMYRQIEVHPADQTLQRILWRKNSTESVRHYQLQTVTYGLGCAPFLAIRTLQQLAHDEGHRFLAAANVVRTNTYMDDILAGGDTLTETSLLRDQLIGLCKAGGMPLRKWTASEGSLLRDLPLTHLQGNASLSWDSDLPQKMLGLHWSPRDDHFRFQCEVGSTETKPTKRSILSSIARLFDPLGWLAPVTTTAKIFMQQLWLLKLGWDEELPDNLQRGWTRFHDSLQQINDLRLERWFHTGPTCRLREIHGFSDASENAYASCVYLRTVDQQGEVHVRLIGAKTKVAPLKKISLPRLELCAAHQLTKLVRHLVGVLQFDGNAVHLWTDSTVVLGWLQGHPSRWTTFVANRVTEVQGNLPHASWHHIGTKENPADCASRGIPAEELLQHPLWWEGPTILHQDDRPIGESNLSEWANVKTEERAVRFVLNTHGEDPEMDLLVRFSRLHRLLRVTAWCLRFGRRTRARDQPENEPHYRQTLLPEEIKRASTKWVRIVQYRHFKTEISALESKEPLPRKSPLLRLDPFIDENGMLRVGGRLKHAVLNFDERHPIILPRNSHFTSLLIDSFHQRCLHGGTQMTLGAIRQQYWILQGRRAVKTHIYRCVTCIRWQSSSAQQKMGQLPVERVRPSRAFLHTGVDYAGPIALRTSKGRGYKSYKGYIAVFKCFSTLAVHLEVVSDYTTAAFLAAYQRFTGRRGLCATLASDCGTNFVGAAAELRTKFKAAVRESTIVADHLAQDGTEWRFNPPAAPHFGGLWESAVRSVKHHLRRVIGDSTLTFEEMTTLLTQIEACVNSRPLQAISDDPEDVSALTPAHFLVGSSLRTVPEPSLLDEKKGLLTRWQYLRQMYEHFWKRWSAEYLQQLQARGKWQQEGTAPRVGDICILKNELAPPSKWPLARVVHLHPGEDGLVRVVTVRVGRSEVKRPLVKLCLLPGRDASSKDNNVVVPTRRAECLE